MFNISSLEVSLYTSFPLVHNNYESTLLPVILNINKYINILAWQDTDGFIVSEGFQADSTCRILCSLYSTHTHTHTNEAGILKLLVVSLEIKYYNSFLSNTG